MMESEKSGLYWLCKEAENRSSAVDSPSPAPEIRTSVVFSPETRPPPHPPTTNGKSADSREDGAVAAGEASVPAAGEKRRRGRPAKGAARTAVVVGKRKKKEDEDVCFICFDGGSLVLCDRGDCPKAYHPACIKRDEAFFSSKAKWNCGWHICSICQKSAARYMCYTCTYSFCKGCTKDASYLSVRGNKGFCSTCFRVIKMIENIDQENKETVQVDFDDKLSWEYLFKVYWICLKSDLSLTVDEINRALLLTVTPNKVTRREKSADVSYIGNKGTMSSEIPKIPNNAVSYINPVRDNNKSSVVSASWASKELLDFVAYMRNGEISALSQREVQALLFDYIKRNNLRDPHQRSEIICDIKLQNLFGKPRVRHFEMLSLLEFHFLTKDEMQGGIIDPVITQVADESNSDNLPMISESYRDKERVDINRSGEVKDTCQKLENHVDSSGSTNNGRNDQACMKTDSLSGVKSETSVASLSTGSTPSANDREAENSWHYQDPKGKVQGPFSIEVLHNWSLTGIFPPDMRIWRVKTEERDSVLLADVIKDQVQSQKNLSLSPQEVKGSTSVSTPQHCDGPESGIANCVRIDTEAHSNGTVEMVKGSGPVVKNDIQINNIDQIKSSSKCGDLEPPKDVDSYLNQPQVKIDAQIKNSSVVDLYLNHPQVKDDIQSKSSSKSWDLEPPKVVDSSLNHNQVKIDAQLKNSSNLDLEPPKVVDTCLNHPQVKIDAQINTSSAENSYVSNNQVTKNIKSSSKCSDAESPKVVDCNPKKPQVRYDAQNKVSSESEDPEPSKFIDSYLNHPQVKSDIQIKSSSKSLIPEPPKVVDSYSNQPQVKNDARVKKSSKRRNPKLPKVVDSCSNHLQGKSDVQKSSLKHLDREQPKVVDSNLNHPQVKNDALIKISSKCRDQELPKAEPPKVFDSNLNYPQVKNNAQNDSFSKSWDPQPPKVVDSFFNHTQVKTEAQNNFSSKSWDPKPPTIVDSYLNQPQVNNDVQIKNSSRSWDLEPANVVNFNMNQAEVHSVELASSYKEKPHEIILHQERTKVAQMWSSTSNYENWSSQGNTIPQSTDKECHEHQFNAQQYRQNSSANNWNSHESHPHYTAMANLTGSSEQKFTINLQDFPMPVKEQHRWPPPEVSVQNLSNIQNVLSLTPKSTHHDERDYFQNQKMSSLSDNYDKVRATDNKHFLSSNFPSEGCGPNWSSAGGTHLPKKATKPFMDEWDTSVLSACSLRPHDVANNSVTPSTSRNDEFLSPSPPNPVPNASSWLAMMTEPIEFNTLAEESVSDLLAEVDAMESNSDLESPNMLMDYADDLFNDSKSNCFTSLRGLSSLNDQVKNEPFYSSVDIMLQPSQFSMQNEKIRAPSNDALSSSIDIMLPPPQSNTRDEKIREPNKDVLENPLKKSKKHSSISSAMAVETKRFEISNNKHNLSPPKKIRDLADIMNGPTKHGTLNSTGSTRRESGQGTPRGSGSKNRNTQDGMSGRESSHQKHGGERLISPREKNVSPRDRNVPGGDSGFSKSRQSWSRQSSCGGGSGGHSRSLSRGQRVCKFYESGYCRKGAFCEYLHP